VTNLCPGPELPPVVFEGSIPRAVERQPGSQRVAEHRHSVGLIGPPVHRGRQSELSVSSVGQAPSVLSFGWVRGFVLVKPSRLVVVTPSPFIHVCGVTSGSDGNRWRPSLRGPLTLQRLLRNLVWFLASLLDVVDTTTAGTCYIYRAWAVLGFTCRKEETGTDTPLSPPTPHVCPPLPRHSLQPLWTQLPPGSPNSSPVQLR